MKKLFLAITIAATFVACKSKESELETNKELLLQDAAMTNSAYLSDTGMISSAAMRGGTVNAATTNNVTAAPAPRRSTSTKRSSGTYSNSGSGTSTASTGTTTTTTQKKGISKAAKGAIIGGVGGAVAGAVIGKGGKGAIIGGVVGAAGGYIIGRSKDRKDGRVQ